MAKLDNAVPEEAWIAVCNILAIPVFHSDLRECFGAALGRYKADLAHGGNVKPADIQKAILNCAEASEAFLKSFGPLATEFDDGALSSAGMHLATALRRDFHELNEIAADIVEIRDACRRLAPEFAVGGGPTHQDARNIFILRVSAVLNQHQLLATNQKLLEVISILMKAGGANYLPSAESLETVIRKIRSEHRKNIKRI